MGDSPVLFRVLGLNVTAEVVTMWGVALLLCVAAIGGTRRLRDVPGRFQNMLEMAVEKLESFFQGILGPERAARFFPFLGTLFLFIVLCNYSGLIPGAGYFPWLKAPTSCLSVTAGLALCAFFATHYLGVRENGLRGYARHFIRPVVFMLPFLIIEEIVRPLSLSLRLFGNIYGEESVFFFFYELLPVGAPLIMMILSLLFCAIQAVVFTMLTAIYIDGATGGH